MYPNLIKPYSEAIRQFSKFYKFLTRKVLVKTDIKVFKKK